MDCQSIWLENKQCNQYMLLERSHNPPCKTSTKIVVLKLRYIVDLIILVHVGRFDPVNGDYVMAPVDPYGDHLVRPVYDLVWA